MNLKVKIRVAGNHKRWLEPLTVTLILAIALFSRTYMLDYFPYFPPEFPWLGDRLGPAGLYGDETGYLNLARDLFNRTTVYQPWLQLFFIHLSLRVFGENSFAARLPSALASTFTAVMVYFATKQKYSKTAALFSSLYFIAMVPALVYNRMVFLENTVALLFMLSIYFLFRYERDGLQRWLYVSGFFAGACTLAKINGLIAPIFFVLYLLKYRRRSGIAKAVLVSLLPPLACFLALTWVSALTQPNLLVLLHGFTRQWLLGLVGRELSSWQYLILASMPSGYLPMLYAGYMRPECWFLFAYFCIAYVAFMDADKAFAVMLALASFVGVLFLIWGISSYYMIIIFPVMALPVGYALPRLLRMPASILLVFLLFVYAPLVALWLGTLAGEPSFSVTLYALKLILFGIPFFLALLSYILYDYERVKLVANAFAILAFFGLLLAGSYLYPVLYPYYFTISG